MDGDHHPRQDAEEQHAFVVLQLGQLIDRYLLCGLLHGASPGLVIVIHTTNRVPVMT
jgi:hypothetical protein